MCSDIIIICMVLIGQYIFYCTRYTILIVTWHYHEWSKWSIPTCMPPSYNTINIIPPLYVYAFNNSAVIFFGGTVGHRHDNIYTSSSAYQSPIHYYHFNVRTNTNKYNNQQQQQNGKVERQRELLIDVSISSFEHTIYN